MAETKGKKKTKKTAPSKQVPIKWNVPADMTSQYASNVVIQFLENEFKISFFETSYEIRVGKNQGFPDEAIANCVASIIINPNKIPGLIKALQQQYDSYAELKPQGLKP